MRITNKKLLQVLGKNDEELQDDALLPTAVSDVSSDTAVSGVQWITSDNPSEIPTRVIHRVSSDPIPIADTRPMPRPPVLEHIVGTPTEKEKRMSPMANADMSIPEPTPIPHQLPHTEEQNMIQKKSAPQHAPQIIDSTKQVKELFRNQESALIPEARFEIPQMVDEDIMNGTPIAKPVVGGNQKKASSTELPDIWDAPRNVSPPVTKTVAPVAKKPQEQAYIPPAPAETQTNNDSLVDELITQPESAQIAPVTQNIEVMGEEMPKFVPPHSSEPEPQANSTEKPDIWETVETDRARSSRATQPSLATHTKQQPQKAEANIETPLPQAPLPVPVEQVAMQESDAISIEKKASTATDSAPFKEALRTDAHTKARIVFELLQGKETATAIAEKYGVSPMHLWLWKRIAEEDMHTIFKKEQGEAVGTKQKIEALEKKIDSLHKLLGERDDEIASLKDVARGEKESRE